VIAGSREVQIGQAPKVWRARGHLVQVIAPPVDRWSGLDRYTQDRKTVAQNLAGDTLHPGGVGGVAEGRGDNRRVRQ
jgi:hypothetical protein